MMFLFACNVFCHIGHGFRDVGEAVVIILIVASVGTLGAFR